MVWVNYYTRYSDTEFTFGDSPVLITTIAFFVAYDYVDKEMPGTVMKHGTVDTIKDYVLQNSHKFDELERHPVFKDVRHFMVDVTAIALVDIDEVNKCLDTTGYIGKFLNKHNLLPDFFDKHEIVK